MSDLVPRPGDDLVPEGWWKDTVMPWADQQKSIGPIEEQVARLAGLEAAYRVLNADTLELTKARRYLEVRWGELLGPGKDVKTGPGRNALHASKALPAIERHRFRRLAHPPEHKARIVRTLEVETESDNLTRAALLRAQKEADRERMRARNRALTLGLQPPEGPAPTIVIDPPWDWGDEGDVDQYGRARPTYATIPIEELEKFPLAELAEPDAHLYLWITNRSLPKGFGLLDAWNFRYVTCLTWVKPSYGMGNYYRGQTEHVLFGVRGSLPLLRDDVGSALVAPRPAGHSTKPDEFYNLIESCSPGPWMDIYARRERPGWLTWGAEIT